MHTKKIATYALICAAALLLCTGCDLLAPGTVVFRVIPSYVEKVDGQYPAVLEYEVSAIVQVSPPINGKSIFVSDENGWFTAQEVPQGTYTLHAVFLDTSYDKTVTVTAGAEASAEPLIFPADIGLNYYAANMSANAHSNTNLTSSALLCLTKVINRSDLLTNAAVVDKDPAFNLIPPAMRNDGMATIESVAEDSVWANANLTGNFAIELGYNNDSTHQAVAEESQNQLEALDAISAVNLSPTDWDTHLGKIAALEYELFRMGWRLDSNNLLVYFEYLISSTGLDDAALNTLVTQAQTALDDEDLDTHVTKLQEIHNYILYRSIIIPLYYYE